jgi:hypothetical protein
MRGSEGPPGDDPIDPGIDPAPPPTADWTHKCSRAIEKSIDGWMTIADTTRRTGEESQMNTDYVLLCGAMWVQYASVDACQELVRALDSDDPDVVLLASALLDEKVASA